MKITLNTQDNTILDKYSKYAEAEYRYQDMPNVSFPIQIEDAPEGTKTFAITFIDHDAVSVVGFSFIHWLACDIEVNKIEENASANNKGMIQGKNSFASTFIGIDDKNVVHRYMGPTPPDKDHDYTLTVYALNTILNLSEGYTFNEFRKSIRGHVIDVIEVDVVGKY